MCIKNTNKKRQPLKPRQGPYKKVNAYTLNPCLEQIITAVVVLIIIILHSIFNVGAIGQYNHPMLNVLLAIHYVMLVVLIYTYVRITLLDPIDDYVLDPSKYPRLMKKLKYQRDLRRTQLRSTNQISLDNPLDDLKQCDLCRSKVHFKSYHCKRCNRCTQNFDHHCAYLNSCIGGKNYEMFLRIVLFFWLFLLNLIFQNIWLFVVVNDGNQQLIPYVKSKWVMIGIIVFCFIFLAMVSALCIFHLYMSLCLDITTLEFIQSSDARSSTDRYSIPQKTPNYNGNNKISWDDLKRSNNYDKKYSKIEPIKVQSKQSKDNKGYNNDIDHINSQTNLVRSFGGFNNLM